MRNLCLLALSVGCAEMEPSDNPLGVVAVEDSVAAAPPVPPAPVQHPPDLTEQVLQEVTKAAKAIADGQDPVEARAKAKAKAKAKLAKAKAAKTSKASKAKARRRSQQASDHGAGGPIHLVSVLPNAVPPRAILALPSGKEIVVKPGQMVPELGLIVLRITAQNVEIAKVEHDGQQASVHTQILQSQY